MKKIYKALMIVVAIITIANTPIQAEAFNLPCGDLKSEVTAYPSTVIIQKPVKGNCTEVKHRIAKGFIRKTDNKTVIVLKNGKKYTMRSLYKDILDDGQKVTVYYSKDKTSIKKLVAVTPLERWSNDR